MKKLLVISVITFIAQIALAQTAATNTGILYITGSTNILYAANDFTNNAGASLTNNGQLYIRGNLSNAQTSMAVGTGTLFLNGAAAQAINGTQTFKTYNLNTNNTSGVTLNNNLSISGTHTFTNGLIASSATPNYLVYESGSSYTGATDAAHVTGWAKKTGATNFTFPVGNNSYLRSIAISNLSGAAEINATYSGPTTNTSNVTAPIAVVNPNEHWTINKISGGTGQVTLNWDNSKVAFPAYSLSDILSSQYTTSWMSTGGTATGNVTTTGSITSTSLSSFGAMAISSTMQILPLSFLSIKATRLHEYTTIEWKTVNEENVAWHEIQKSLYANNFNTIGKLPAINLMKQTYQFNDSAYLNGTAYYRIKSIDLDGKTKYSTIVHVADKSTDDLILLRNPVTNMIQVSGGKNNVTYQYTLFSNDGKTVQKGVLSGESMLTILLNKNIFPGTYILTVNSTMQHLTKKIMVQ